MNLQLDAVEARILGSLIEKSYLTPDQYPLSFNALLNACNQKTSREPVMELDIDAMGRGLERLRQEGLVEQKLGSRVPKFAHAAARLGAGDTAEILGLLCLLLLRGAQTAAELRVRTERMSHFAATGEVEAELQKLAEHPEGPFVAKLARGRYQHLFSGASSEAAAPIVAPGPDKLAQLEARVAALETLCKDLQERLAKPASA
ncbi:MAG: DUF480 domain-containing protein [Elusimicrobia bacterium]|nr:DUF480 domain-containing protein [Elusimicrobiota bacterium]